MYTRTFQVFWEKELNLLFNSRHQAMQAEINGQPDNYILNVNETEYVSYLVSRYSIENIELRFDEVFVSTYEKDIPAEQTPARLSSVNRGRTYRKDVIKYHIPFTGDQELLQFKPNRRLMWTIDVSIEDGCLCFDIINFYNAPDAIKRAADEAIQNIRSQAANVVNNVAGFNSSLPGHAQEMFQARKGHLLKKGDLMAALGVPIKKRENYPQTFAILTPQTRRKIQVAQPVVTEKGYRADPTLEPSVYGDILQVIHDIGRQFERMPSTYANKSEEDLRDHILLLLEPRFEGSATGETFNKTGKTDILLRYQGSNVFIAECKFWHGAKAFLKTITQLLGYLTWRDSKAAVVIFVQNKDMTAVINTVEAEAPTHSNYLGFVGKKEDTWLNYRFHTNDDSNREVKLAVLLFHIPPV